MTPTPEVQQRLRRYLLGDLSDAERERLEQDLLTSDELFEELLTLEDEITDDYVAQRLSPDDRNRFNQYFLTSSAHQAKLKFARALDRTTKTHRLEAELLAPESWFKTKLIYRAAALTALAAIVAGSFWAVYHRRTQPITFATLQLNVTETTRSNDTTPPPTLQLPLHEDAVRVIMNLAKEASRAPHYRVALETDFSEKRFIEAVAQDNDSVTVVLPSGDLRRGQYGLSLFAVDDNGASQRLRGNYRFNVQ